MASLLAAAAWLVSTLLGSTLAEAATVKGITVTTLAGFTRVTVDLSEKAKPMVAHLDAEPEKGRPNRIALDFSGAELDVGGPTRIDVRDGRIDAVRFGRTRDGGVRVLIDLVMPARHRAMRHISPPRIELDVLGPGADAGGGRTP